MTYGTLDHLLVATLALVVPLLGAWGYRRMAARLAAGDSGVRTRTYRKTIAQQLAAGAVVLGLWAAAGRPVERLVSLDWVPSGWWTAVAWGVVLLLSALLVAQLAALRGNEAGLASARKQVAPLEGFLPRTPVEIRLFLALSLAAGVCEEIVYRGYLLSYFGGFVGPAGAVLASTLLFGLAHGYQGPAGIVRTGVVGLVLAVAYVLTGSLLAAVLLHVVIDATSGLVAYLALRPVAPVAGAPNASAGSP